jgi:hypothetical protein
MKDQINQYRIIYIIVSLLILGCEGEDGIIGEAGLNSLLLSIEEPKGINCKYGGLRIVSGLDVNRNNILEDGEIIMTEFACNGSDAETTLSSFVNVPPGMICPNGGIQLNFGIDSNKNIILDEGEIVTTVSLCNGSDGNTIFTRLTNLNGGEKCELGGVQIEWGLDDNGNGQLDTHEIINIDSVCNGSLGNKSLITITNGTIEDCLQGGIVIQSGVDTNQNNYLEVEEIEIIRMVCNGIDGRVSEEIRLPLLLTLGSSSGFIDGYAVDVLNFDIRNWENATEVYLSANIRTSNSISTASAQLTSMFGAEIVNSSVSTNDTEFQTLVSDNFLDNIPEQEITLRLLLTSEFSDEIIWITGKTELIIIQQEP